MIGDSRDLSARKTRSHLEQADDSTLVELISGGSGVAFAALFDRTRDAAEAELAADFLGDAHAREILAASYVEVWWLAGCHRADGSDVRAWIVGIVRRRIAEAPRPAGDGPRPSYGELEFESLLQRT